MQIKKIENSPEGDVAIIINRAELEKLFDCIRFTPPSTYSARGARDDSPSVIQPFYSLMSNYLWKSRQN